MRKTDFLATLQSDKRVEMNDFACERLHFFLSKIDDNNPADTGLLEMLALKILSLSKNRIYANDLFYLLRQCVQSQANFEGKHSKIKNFKGSRYEEEALLEAHFFDKRLKDLGIQWLKEGE